MRLAGIVVALAIGLCARESSAQNVKQTCADASERGQKLVDDRKLLQARNAFLSCAQESCPGPVRRDCQSQVDELKKTIPSMIIRVKEKDGSDAAQGSVSLDGTKIGVLDGQLLEADPGTHKVHVELPDGRVYDRQVILAAGEHGREVTFDASASATAPAAPVVVEKPVVGTQWSTVKTLGLVTIIVGGSAIVIGVATQLLAFVFQGDATTQQNKDPSGCVTLSPPAPPAANPNDGSTICNSAVSYHQQALAMQTVTIGLFVGGGAALIGGIVMFAVGGNRPARAARLRVTPLVSPTFAGLGLGGSF